MPKPSSTSEPRRWPDHRTVWRWHFYAGLFCIPFVLWLATTGSIYLFKPQIEQWLDRPYEQLQLSGASAPPSAQVQAALAAVPGSVLNAYELPATARSATRVLAGQGAQVFRVYVHPESLEVLRVVDEDKRFMQLIFHLHGELLQGDRGSMVVELAASWTIVMLITGLYLWWPTNGAGLAGVVYPRLNRGRRFLWRDLHAVTGFWIAFFALFLLISGLPWAKSWGGMLKEVRKLGSVPAITQDWTTGRSSELAERRLANAQEWSEHSGHHSASVAVVDEHASHSARGPANYKALDRIVPVVQAARLHSPVLITPPSEASANWTAKSDTQNRPKRVTLQLDGATANIIARQEFSDRPLMDRIVGVGVAAHEGQLFAPLNQVLGVFTTLGLITLSISAIILWLRRRPTGVLGAPHATARPKLAWALIAVTLVLAVLLPLFGASLLIMLCIERFLLRRLAPTREFLGLSSDQHPA
jgi:uncharacterized iron-regulated membrane protein